MENKILKNNGEVVETQCVVCGEYVLTLEKFNGEMMCPECYDKPENYIFGEEDDND